MTFRNKPYPLTEEGLEEIRTELTRLRTKGREAIAERLQRAFEDGQDDDFVDNAELEAARNEQSFLEGRIQQLETILSNYTIISHDDSQPDIVTLGDVITVVEVGFDEEERYHLVGAAEANPSSGKISNESPLGRAVLGAKVGQIISYTAPSGVHEFKVIKIE